MAKLVIRKHIPLKEWEDVGANLLQALSEPRDDILRESPQVADTNKEVFSFGLSSGPFEKYRREVRIQKNVGGTDDEGDVLIVETYTFKLALVFWRFLLTPPVRHFFKNSSALDWVPNHYPLKQQRLKQPQDEQPRSKQPHSKKPWWAPSTLLDARSANSLSILCLLSIIGGYMGTLLSQTLTFVGDDFSVDTRTQGYVLAIIRVGVVLALILTAAADRFGRRTMVGWVAALGCVFTILTAIAPNIVIYTLFQTLARALTTSFALLLGIMAAEETPASARAYSASVLSLSAALGAGGVVWLLPLADLAESSWRILYLVPTVALVGLVFLLRNLPETLRFEKHFVKSGSGSKGGGERHKARLLLLGISSFFLAIFVAPASQFQNEFLRDERGFSAAKLTIYQLTTNTPAGVGVFVGGKLADLKGRKLVGAVGLLGGVIFVILRYWIDGWTMWLWGGLASILGAAIIPALGVYGPELFGTTRRGRSGGWLALMAVAGSALGLILVGYLADSLGSFGQAFGIAAIAPLIVVFLLIFKFPETAGVELEELNPEDK